MNMHTTIRTNIQIGRLIESKHEEGWPGTDKGLEAKYYHLLKRDLGKVKVAISESSDAPWAPSESETQED